MDKTTKEIIGGMHRTQREVVYELAINVLNIIEGDHNKEEIKLFHKDGMAIMNFIDKLDK